MTPRPAASFRLLAGEALADATRRRIVPVVVVFSLLSLLFVDSCTACEAGTFVRNGEEIEIPQVAGFGSLVLFAVLALWTIALAGILAAGHLSETLEDGTASLVLARPVGRPTFALARLAGALAIALLAGVALLGGTALLSHLRQALPLLPAAWAGLACAGGALCVASLAMVASLALPGTAAALVAMLAVAFMAFANALALLGAELGGFLGLLDRVGPPLLTAVVLPLDAWIEPTTVPGDPAAVGVRLALWAGAAAFLLVAAFRRIELR